jgi:hypothetical protein
MAYTGTSPTVYVTLCEQYLAQGGAVDCVTWVPVPASVFVESNDYSFDVQQVEDLIGVALLILALIFIIGICKKAIEQ